RRRRYRGGRDSRPAAVRDTAADPGGAVCVGWRQRRERHARLHQHVVLRLPGRANSEDGVRHARRGNPPDGRARHLRRRPCAAALQRRRGASGSAGRIATLRGGIMFERNRSARLLASTLVLALAACGGGGDATTDQAEAPSGDAEAVAPVAVTDPATITGVIN